MPEAARESDTGDEKLLAELDAVSDAFAFEVGWRLSQVLCAKVAARLRSLRAEREGLRDLIATAEILTATGEGLEPEETMRLHLMLGAARGDAPVTRGLLALALIEAQGRANEAFARTERAEAALTRIDSCYAHADAPTVSDLRLIARAALHADVRRVAGHKEDDHG